MHPLINQLDFGLYKRIHKKTHGRSIFTKVYTQSFTDAKDSVQIRLKTTKQMHAFANQLYSITT